MSNELPPQSENPFAAPQQPQVQYQTPASAGEEGDKTGGLIPYKNPHALIAYYLGIVALLPLLGLPFGIASVILGIIGLRKRREKPIIKGSVHAIIGIVFGVFSILCGGGIMVSIIINVLANPR